eukprot:scaffold69559_cov18-Tisochrysis_lutea.AAC.1
MGGGTKHAFPPACSRCCQGFWKLSPAEHVSRFSSTSSTTKSSLPWPPYTPAQHGVSVHWPRV